MMATPTPIVKWAGGKGRLLAQFAPHFPRKDAYRRYFEPFFGGGALFFHLQPPHSFLYDLNPHLIEMYQTVRDDVEALIAALKPHIYDRAHYYAVRAQHPELLSPTERAARFIFLNHTCYNGLYRVNRNGQFNVPFGRYTNPTICDEAGLRAASHALRDAAITVSDFRRVEEYAQQGDFIYFDPPYEPLTRTANFTSYTQQGFTTADQRRLMEVFRTLDRRGCLLILSNSDTPIIRELYGGFHIHEIHARRAINRDRGGRGIITELLITNFQSLEQGDSQS